MASLISQAEYARIRGCSQAAVRKAVKSGRISLINGQIDPSVADIQWNQNTDKAQSIRANASKMRAEPHGSEYHEDADLAGMAASGDVRASEYMTWKARREKAAALREELELANHAGTLCDKAGVERAARTAGRMLRDQIMAVPSRIAAELANLTDPQTIEHRIRDELRTALASTERLALQMTNSVATNADNSVGGHHA